MNKSNFDERIENLRKRTKFRSVNDAGDHQKYVNKSSFVSQKIFNKSFVAILEIKPVLTLGKPIHVGFSIFDLSKLLMHEFHYRHIKKIYNANLLFRDTDSLAYEIEKEDVYEDFYQNKSYLILVTMQKIQSF